MPSYPELAEKAIVVTGGANGIGNAMVRKFHGEGANVFFCDIDAAAGKDLQNELGERAAFAKVDLAREKSIVRWIERIAAKTEVVHCLINNAAIDDRVEFDKTTVAFWDKVFATNIRSAFIASREAARHMDAGSSIVNLSSVTFHHGPERLVPYVTTKGGMIGFTRSLGRELGPRRIRVNTLSPGWVMTERQLKSHATPKNRKRLLQEWQSLPDLLQPEEIADVALFLASAGAAAITGQEILVDRGWMHS
jgi:prepilin-type processing-associated H-X9-DG protein